MLRKAAPRERRFPHAGMVRVPSLLMRGPLMARVAVAFVTVSVAGTVALAAAPGPSAREDEAARTVPAIAAPIVADLGTVPRAAAAVAPIDQGPAPKSAPASASIEMKHVWQSLNNCGPASIVMALSSFGLDVSQEDARVPLRGTNVLSGMGPQKVDGWVRESFGLRAIWRNNGTNDLLRQLVANGFTPLVTQWMQDPSISRIAHWRVVRGYDDALAPFYVNDPMLGNGVPLGYRWFQDNWQPLTKRYMVTFAPKGEALLKAIVRGERDDVN